jgi:hypothetical protein
MEDAIPVVVVVDQAETRRHRVAESIRHAGGRSIEAATPLEAIAIVESGNQDIDALAIAQKLTQTGGDELVSYMSITHPDLEVAVIPERPPTEDDHPDAAVVLPCDGRDATGPVRPLVERAAEHHRRL